MSERSLSCPPNTLFAFGLSAATVVAPTSVPQVNITATFYEYPVPLALGAAPLSPTGWLYKELLHNFVGVASGTIIDRDLSNFTYGRWMVRPDVPGAAGRYLIMDIWDWSQAAYTAQIASVAWVHFQPQSVTFHAGKPIRLMYQTSDIGVFGALTDQLEAW